jgi:hypothetical protein
VLGDEYHDTVLRGDEVPGIRMLNIGYRVLECLWRRCLQRDYLFEGNNEVFIDRTWDAFIIE